ncbi:MAG TPA: ribonuclease P [Archaeoglobaceae archaeon]|nr:ribonuclease P [Archaeoglobaceae archaeon]
MIRREKRLEKKIAGERIKILIEGARKRMFEDYEIARRNIIIATRISQRYRVKIPRELKITYCKKCFFPYRSDRFRVRVKKSRVIITCLNCGERQRFPIV